MTDQSFPAPSLFYMLDSFALAAMEQLIAIHAPEKLITEDEGEVFDDIARVSYYMAAAMMDARSTLHEILLEQAAKKQAQKEESDET